MLHEGLFLILAIFVPVLAGAWFVDRIEARMQRRRDALPAYYR